MSEQERALQQKIAGLEHELRQLQEERRLCLQDRAAIALLTDQDNSRFGPDALRRLYGVRIQGDRFVLCAFTDSFSIPGALDEKPMWESLNSSFYVKLSGLIRPAFADQPGCITCNGSGMIYCLVNLSETLEREQLRPELLKICNRINDTVERQEGFRFRIFVSPIGYGLGCFPQLRRDVEHLMEYQQIVGGTQSEILFAEDLRSEPPKQRRSANSQAFNEQFSNYINRGDFELAKSYFRREITSQFLETPHSITLLRFRIAGLLDYMLQTLTRAGQDLGLEQVLDEVGAEQLLLSAENLDEITLQMDTILDAMNRQWQSMGSAKELLAQQVRAYINEHYADQDLNVNSVAEQLGVSASHITRVFQTCYHVGVLYYIQQVRLDAAKRLLRTNLTLREVALAAGYGAQINMTRAFKRLTGKTPSQYLQED